eukprot:511716_1
MERYYHKTSSMLTMKLLLFIVFTVRIGMSYGSSNPFNVPSNPFNVPPLTPISMPRENQLTNAITRKDIEDMLTCCEPYPADRAARYIHRHVLGMLSERRRMSRKQTTPSIPAKDHRKIRIPTNSGSKLNLKHWHLKYNVQLSYKAHSDDKSEKHKNIPPKTKHSHSRKLKLVLNTNKKPAQKRGVKRSHVKPDCIDLTAGSATEDEQEQPNTSDTLETDFKHMIDESIRMRESLRGGNKFMHPDAEDVYPDIPRVGLHIVTDDNYVGDDLKDGTYSVMSASANTQTYSTNTNDDVKMPDKDTPYMWRDVDPKVLPVVEEYEESRIVFIYKANDDDKKYEF